jgi:aryl-alcohol dehydrogenase-like predicted oxidoreductase
MDSFALTYYKISNRILLDIYGRIELRWIMSRYSELAPGLKICRVLNGMWQVAGGHGRINPELAIAEMVKYHDAGFTTWDLADIYGPAEDFIGEFRRTLSRLKGEEELRNVQALTKWVPDPQRITRSIVQSGIERSMRRMGVSSIDLLQFHWWDYNNPYYIDALKHLFDLRNEGKIRQVGLTNFDTERMEVMRDAGLHVASNQVQYSIVDRRPEARMARFCKENNASLLAYGTVCGGLMSERYLGRQEPSQSELDTLSLRKYKRMVDAWGGWDLFQELLSTLKGIAQKHGVSIANVATRYILDRPAVAGVIIGARLGIADHRQDNARVFDLSLDSEDAGGIEDVCKKSNDLLEMIGDCGDEYR